MCSTKLKDSNTEDQALVGEVTEKPHQRAHIDEVGILSYITFGWVFKYLWDAYKGRIKDGDIWPCSIFDSANVNCTRLEHLWSEELKTKPDRPSLFMVVFRFMSYRLLVACVIFMICLIFGFIGPTCLVRGLVAFTENPPKEGEPLDYSSGLYLVFAILLVEITRVLMYGATWVISYRTAIRVRGALLTLLYKNLLNSKTLNSETPAEIVNVFANDGQRIFDAVTFAPLVLMGPLVIIGGVIYLLKVIGSLSLLGLGVFLVFDVVQAFLGITMTRCRRFAVQMTENRMKLTGEVLRNIRVIKMNNWEDVFMQKILDARKEETRYIVKAGYAQSLAIAMGVIVPVVATVVTVLSIIWSGSDLLASDIFSAITVFVVMLFGVRMIPYGLRYMGEASVAIRRIQRLLMFEKFEASITSEGHVQHAVVLKNASFTHPVAPVLPAPAKKCKKGKTEEEEVEELNADPEFCLHSLNLTVDKNAKVAIYGEVGSGKSSLLQAIFGCMSEQKGQLFVSGSAAYVPQTTCVMSGTVRDNILFGLPLNNHKYSKVINASCLTKDLEKLPFNEKSEVGERGAALSGGQRARLALARAFYANKDVYLFDDVLAAVNKQVAHKIFDQGIKDYLANKTVFLVTSKPEFLEKCDTVLFVSNGTIEAQGKHKDLLESCPEYAESFHHHEIDRATDDNENDIEEVKVNLDGETQQLVEDEDLGAKNVSTVTYVEYIKAFGGFALLSLVMVVFIINVGANIFGTFWLSKWMKDVHGHKNAKNGTSLANDPNQSYHATVYIATIIVLFLSGLIKAAIFVKLSMRASSILHSRMLKSLLRGVVSFFDVTPTGRILNRFSKDLDEVDVKLPFSFEALMQYVFTCTGLIITMCWVFPLLLLTFFPLSALFILFFLCFRVGIRSLKRTENVTRSPVFDHISSSLEGLSTVHAFSQHNRFIDTFKSKLDDNTSMMLLFNAAQRWQAVWLDLLVVAISFFVSGLIVFLTGKVEPSDAGMALAFALQMSGIFQYAVRSQTELEARITSVERISEYYNTITQEDDSVGEILNEKWPENGSIKFENVLLRYRPETAPALNSVSFEVNDGQKTLIVGRTGSGKSSLVNVIFRLYEIQNGDVTIDGVSLKNVSLNRLRRSLTVIPQDGGLFLGSLRFNLDPTGGCADQKLWEALEKAGLKTFVSGTTEKLELAIEDSGKNLSAGQRQLVCLARALLKETKIVVLDEATSSLDIKTDISLQNTIKEVFQQCTVLIISHRPEYSNSVDKLLKVEDGQITSEDVSSDN